MLRSQGALLERMLRTGDHVIAAGVTLAALGFWKLTDEEPFPLVVLAVTGTLSFPICLSLSGLYSSQRRESLARVSGRVLGAAALVWSTLLAAAVAVGRPEWITLTTTIAWTQFSLLAGGRLMIHSGLRFARRRGRNIRQIVVLGSGPRGSAFASEVAAHPAWGLQIVACLDDEDLSTPGFPIPVHKLIDFPKVVRSHAIDEVVVALPRSQLLLAEPIVRECASIGVPVSVLSDLFTDVLPAVRSARYGRLKALQFGDVAYSPVALFVKRSIDVVVATLLLLMLGPLIGLSMVAIRLTSPGTVLYRQTRLGQNGRPFQLLKLRSMVQDADAIREELLALNEMSGPVFKITDDPRVTPVGAWLRRWSIDELPQLWNVLRGDMSLVGPRPPLPHEVDQYEARDRRRISVRPGVTCLWQIGGRNRIQFADWVALDLHYIDHWSLSLDLWILLCTPMAVIRKDGAS